MTSEGLSGKLGSVISVVEEDVGGLRRVMRVHNYGFSISYYNEPSKPHSYIYHNEWYGIPVDCKHEELLNLIKEVYCV